MMEGEHLLVERCLRLIEKKLQWGDPTAWHNDMFAELSERIHSETQVLLSPTTLKRVWGRVKYRNDPSITTLNTLAKFAGFANWRDYKSAHRTTLPNRWRKIISLQLGVIMLAASIMTVVFISLYSLRTPTGVSPIDRKQVVFRSRPIATGLPNSVVFDIRLPENSSDSIFIQQYWDPTKTVRLKNGQETATAQYYLPGHFRAKLLVDGQVIKEHGLLIPSDGWLATVDYEPIPEYIRAEEVHQGGLSLPSSVTDAIRASDDPLVSGYHWVGSPGQSLPGDNFKLTTKIQHTINDSWAVCQKTGIYLLGTEGVMIIPFAIPGCISEIGLTLNDVYLNGKDNDLSEFGIDLSEPLEVTLQVQNKEVRIIAGGNELYHGAYLKSMGHLVGIRYRFLGAGKVVQCTISDLEGKKYLIKEGPAGNKAKK